LQQTIKNIQVQQQAVAQSYLDSGSTINNLIVPVEIPEINNKFINYIYQIYLTGGKDSLISHLSEITVLANQCPSAGGPSVFTARTIASLFNDSIEYDDEIVCLQQGIYRHIKAEEIPRLSNNNDFILIPNPANEKVEIRIQKLFTGICKVVIYDAMNSLKLEKEIDCSAKSHFINTALLSPGTYFVKLITEQGHTIKKLVIIR